MSPLIHYLTILLMGLNLFLMVRLFLHYGRFRKRRIPGLGYCLAFIGVGVAYSLLCTASFLLPEGPLLDIFGGLQAYVSIVNNTFFMLTAVYLTSSQPKNDVLLRIQPVFFIILVAAGILYCTNHWHHLLLKPVTKAADGFLYTMGMTPYAMAFTIYSFLLSLIAVYRILRPGARGVIPSGWVRGFFFLTVMLPSIFQGLDNLIPLLGQLRLSYGLLWVPIYIICHLFFGYLSTARHMAIDVMDEAYVVFDMRGNCVDINDRAEALFMHHLSENRPRAAQFAGLLGVSDLGQASSMEFDLVLEEKRTYYHLERFPLSSGLNRHCGNGYIIREVTEYRQKMNQLSSLATEDALTGAKNRRFLNEVGDELLKETVGTGLPTTVMMLDLDFFKRVNDTYGHPAGDEVLITVYRLIRNNVRDGDIVFRYGGEEFMVLSSGCDATAAQNVAERIRHAVEEHPFTLNGTAEHITVSIGVHTGLPTPNDTIEQMVELADRNLYAAKANGRNQACFSQGTQAVCPAVSP